MVLLVSRGWGAAVTLMDLDLVVILAALVILLAFTLLVVLRRYSRRVAELELAVADAKSSRQSLATTYGRITEQFAPFLPAYPFNPRNFRFLGSPVDGVQFEDDRILFVEFKANTSRLTGNEARLKRLVEEGRVGWFEFRVDERRVPDVEAGAAAPWRRPDEEDEDARQGPDDERSSSSWGAER